VHKRRPAHDPCRPAWPTIRSSARAIADHFLLGRLPLQSPLLAFRSRSRRSHGTGKKDSRWLSLLIFRVLADDVSRPRLGSR